VKKNVFAKVAKLIKEIQKVANFITLFYINTNDVFTEIKAIFVEFLKYINWLKV